MHSLELIKPDGRALTLYARAPLDAGRRAPSPFPEPLAASAAPALASAARRMGHLRGASAGPHLPAAARIQPARADDRPGAADRAAGRRLGRRGVRQPVSLARRRARTTPPPLIVPTAPAGGHCEVVVYTQDREASLGALPLVALRAAARSLGATARARWARATTSSTSAVREPRRRGRRRRCTIRTARSMRIRSCRRCRRACCSWQRDHYAAHGRGLLERLIAAETARAAPACCTTARTLSRSCRSARATPTKCGSRRFAPVAVRATRRCRARATSPARSRPCCSSTTASGSAVPYLMAWYQAPTDGDAHPERTCTRSSTRPTAARPAQVPRRDRARRRLLRHGRAARGQGARAAGDRGDLR